MPRLGSGAARARRVALGLSLGAAVALGFSRFAYALLLPPMRDALGWSYAEAGALNTANAVGYVAGALSATPLARRFGARRAFIGALMVSSAVLLASAAPTRLGPLFVLRTLGGVATACCFILGAALAGAIASDRSGRFGAWLVGLYVAGAGTGIAVSGLAVPPALASGPEGWRLGWLVLGGLAALACWPAWRAAAAVPVTAPDVDRRWGFGAMRGLGPVALAYGLFGAGYAGYMTFVIALLGSQGATGSAGPFWILLGITAAVSTMLWGLLLGRMEGGRGPALVFGLAAVGTLPTLLMPGLSAAIGSALLFGGSFLAGPAAVAIVARQRLPPAALTAGIAWLTVVFSLGQSVGPLLSGAVSDWSGDLADGLWTAPVLLALAMGAALLQRTGSSCPDSRAG